MSTFVWWCQQCSDSDSEKNDIKFWGDTDRAQRDLFNSLTLACVHSWVVHTIVRMAVNTSQAATQAYSKQAHFLIKTTFPSFFIPYLDNSR